MKGIVVFIVLLVFSSQAFAAVIDRVDISGNKRVSEKRIRQYTVKVGEEFDPEKISRSVKQLQQTGYFMEVTVDAGVDNDQFVITYILQEMPLIASIEVNGSDHFTAEKLKEAYAMRVGETLSFTKMGTTIQNMQAMYEKDQYYSVKITHRLEYRNINSVNVVFDVEEGKTSRVYNIWLHGNVTFTDDELRAVMNTKEKDFWSLMNSSGTLIRDGTEYDRELLREFYQSKGFALVEVGEPEIAFQTDMSRMNYLLRINEGPRFTVKTITYEDPTGIFTPAKLKEAARLKEGEYFDVTMYRGDIRRLTDAYMEIGHAKANIDSDVQMHQEDYTVDLSYTAEPGPIVYIDKIIFEGNEKTRDNVLRREFDILEGNKYNSKLINEGRGNLYTTGFFETVNIAEQYKSDNITDLLVRIKEKDSGSINLGISYSTADMWMGKLEFAQANLFGFGSTLKVAADVSNKRQNYVISFVEPWILDNPYSLGVDLYSRTQEYDDYTGSKLGGAFNVGHQPIKRRLYLNYTFAHDENTVKAIADNASKYIKAQEGLSITNSITPSITYTKLNNNLDPSDGLRLNGRLKYAGTFLGGDNDYTKLILEGSYYIPMGNSFVGVIHLEGGRIWPLSDDPIPIEERFYLGGMYSVRGFDNDEISPVDSDGEKYGGNKYYQGNLEIWRPIFEGNLTIRGVIFFDFGQSFDETETFFSAPPRKTTGMGIRFYTPMGLIRLEYGYKLDKKPEESPFEWAFSIGSTF